MVEPMAAGLLPDPGVDDGVYQVYALRFGSVPGRRVHENFLRRDMHDGPMPLDFYVWIVRNAWRVVLVDTGFGKRAAEQRRFMLDVDPIDALSQLGIEADAIDDVVITHLHFDHAGNLDRFANARFHVQVAEAAFATGPCMCEPHLRAPFDVEDAVQLVRHVYAERVRFHEGDGEVAPGISVHLVPGHTAGIQAVRVMTARGPVVLASDSSHLYANAARRSPFSLTVDAIATLRSYERLLELAGSYTRVVPGHDPKVRELYPSHEFAGLSLAALHEEPRSHDVEELARLPRY
jgi:glyoxylase-like metal-dependent hydrolase (beta-lactamase superfamily II)